MAGMPERLVIPDDLARAAAAEGRCEWLAELPALVARIAADWQVDVGGRPSWRCDRLGGTRPRPCGQGVRTQDLLAAPGGRSRGRRASSVAGAGAIRVFRAEELAEATVLLLERCRPGTPLRALPPEQHDLVIAGLLRRLWIRPPSGHCFRPLSDMCDYWASRYEHRSAAERSCLEGPQATEGIRLLRELPRTGGDVMLLHTDLHAGNVLAAEREAWLAIDPKPYVGDPAYDVTQHLFNGVFVEQVDVGAVARRMARLLDLDLGRILRWLFARAVEASPYWPGMADLARTLYSSLP